MGNLLGGTESTEKTGVVTKSKSMTTTRATFLIEGIDEGTEEDIIAAWQYLHTTGHAYQLQGWYGRRAQQLLKEGVIK